MAHFRFRRSFGNVGTRRFRGARPDATPPPEEDLLFTVDTSLGANLVVRFDSAQVYDATIDWGDGTSPFIVGPGAGTVTKPYGSVGTFQVRVSGTFAPEIALYSNQNIISVENLGKIGWTNLSSMFFDCQNLVSFNTGNTDISSVTNLSGMLNNCLSLSTANLSTFDTSQITNIVTMFGFCNSLTALDLSNWDTSNVEDVRDTFFYCTALETLLLPDNFVTSNVTSISSMFQGCNSLTTLDLSDWDTSNVGYFTNTFRGCNSLETLLLPDNFVTSSALQLIGMLYDCQSLQNLDVSTWDTSSVRSMNAIFVRCFGLTDIVGLETNISITGLNITGGLNNTANNVPNQGTDYDALLINWEANLPTSGLAQSPRFNLSKVTTTAGNNARNSLINNYNWVILDGGPL
jgi:surface protein